jgi:hypothetical protein
MTFEEHKGHTTSILSNSSDVGKVSEILTVLTEDYVSMLAAAEALASENAKLTADNASLLEQNMNLFLKVGAPAEPEKEEEAEPDIEDLKFDDLFDGLGNLV